MHHSDDKLGTIIWRKGTLILARVPKDLRDPRVLRDTKISAQNNDKWHRIATGFQLSRTYNSALCAQY